MEMTGISGYPAFSRARRIKNCGHDLADYHQRGVAGIVIHIFQTHINSGLVGIRKYFQLISGSPEGRLNHVKVNG